MQDYNNIKVNFDHFIQSLKTTTDDLEFRKKSFNHFLQKGYPVTKDENWKYSPLTKDLKKFTKFDFVKNQSDTLPNEVKELYDHYSIVFVDGSLISSDINETGFSIKKNNSFLKSVKKEGDNPILNLNNAFAETGYLIEIEQGYSVSKPIVIYNYFSKNPHSSFFSFKNFILLNEESKALIFEKNIYLSDREYLITSNTEVFLGKNSELKKYNFNYNNKYSTIFNYIKANLDMLASFECFTFSHDINSCRDELIINLNGKDSFASINALQLQHSNFVHEIKLQINHNEEFTKSSQFVKSVLHENSTAVFQGKIFVDSKAQKTDGYQLSRALLLSDNVKFFSKPELEIYADDVKCSHGSSSGSIDNESIFYLRSRGIDEKSAKQLMINGFLAEVIDKISNKQFRDIFINRLGGI